MVTFLLLAYTGARTLERRAATIDVPTKAPEPPEVTG
jgi:hypothetical protein